MTLTRIIIAAVLSSAALAWLIHELLHAPCFNGKRKGHDDTAEDWDIWHTHHH
jgi:hypothetical protein